MALFVRRVLFRPLLEKPHLLIWVRRSSAFDVRREAECVRPRCSHRRGLGLRSHTRVRAVP